MFTVAQVIANARTLVQDKREPYRYSTEDMARYISDAVMEARRLRPDLFLTTSRASLPIYDASNLNTTVPMPDSYYPQIVNYVAGRAELRDDTFSNEGRAAMLIGSYTSALGGS